MWWVKFTVASTIALLSAASCAQVADASDERRATPPAVSPLFDWSGLYVGGHIAYNRGRALTLTDANSPNFPASFGSFHGGLHAGYNFVLPSRLLFGLEGDISFPNFLNSDDVVSARLASRSVIVEKLDLVSTLRARLGYAFNHWLIYATAGVAWSQARLLETALTSDEQDKVLRLRTGGAMGAGVEFAMAPHWMARLEYRHDWLSKVAVGLPSGAYYESSWIDLHSVRLALNRQLRWSDTESAFGKSSGAAELMDWNIHGQSTFVGQGYFRFRSPYQGSNSLAPIDQAKNTVSATAFFGLRPWQGTEFYINPELMQGFGLSDVHGLAAFPNGEAQKSSFPIPRSNIARVFVRQTFGLGGEQEVIEDGPNQLTGKQDISRLTVTVGKLAVTDSFDGNSYANDPRTTFLNWNIYGGGSYDWTMDKLSYTWGGLVELNQQSWAIRAGYFLLPDESNSNHFDTHIPSRGEYAAELELRYSLAAQPGKLRFFGWVNRGNMGQYSAVVALPVTTPGYPDIAMTRAVRTNYGFVVSAEQAVTADLGVFSRASWSPGRVEVMGWTDCDDSFSLGAVLKGTSWGRPNDKIGVAGVTEGLSPEARAYFVAGGLGILIGDGQLNYRRENVLEAYYAYSVNKWATLTLDYQFVVNPGYNTDRGPVSIFSVRTHAEF